MVKILPYTERFIMVFNKLKNEKKLPSNQDLADQLGIPSGNTFTEIKGGRQNISLDVLQKFCDIYGNKNGFSMSDFTGNGAPIERPSSERALLIAMLEDYASYKAEKEGMSFESVKSGIRQKARLILGLDSWLPEE